MKYIHIGWCKEGIHDKVWGVILIREGRDAPYFEPNDYISFWGRRGTKLRTKPFSGTAWTAMTKFDTKIKEGYAVVNIDQLNDVYPEFQQDLEKTAIWATLSL